jgi:hypothetical protein
MFAICAVEADGMGTELVTFEEESCKEPNES